MNPANKYKLFVSLESLLRSVSRYIDSPSDTVKMEMKEALGDMTEVLNIENEAQLVEAAGRLSKTISDSIRSVTERNESEKKLVGSFPTNLSYLIVQEMGRRKISYEMKELDSYISQLYVPLYSLKEATVILDKVKENNKRIRI